MARKTVADPQPFVVRRSGIQGKGGFATRDIRKGERLTEYLGERITWKQADARYDDEGMRRHHTFLFSVTSRTVIDAAVGGNDARFINHSCDPNCEAIDEKGRIYVEAIKPIAKGEELFYDYAYARDRDTTEEDEQLYVCRCGTAKCRGTILEPPKRARRRAHHVAARHPQPEQASTPRGGATQRSTATGNGSAPRRGDTKRSTPDGKGSTASGGHGGAKARGTRRR